jgi:pimeloyl-ACP methyl ester carboxylesterase
MTSISRVYRIGKFVTLGFLGLVAVILAAALIFRAYLQHGYAQKLAIRTPNGIQEGMYVPIGGIEQWVQIRGEDRENPVILFVHGGPGGSTLVVSSGWQPWEKYFTMVQWDERGAGRTLRKTGTSIAPTMTVDRMAQDGIEVVEFLRAHLQKDKVILVGHSWGSILGIEMAKKRPDYFFAYVGTGQLVGVPSSEKMMRDYVSRLRTVAQTANNTEAVDELSSVQALPYGAKSWAIAFKWRRRLGIPFPTEVVPSIKFKITPPVMPGFSLIDFYYYIKGMRFSREVITQPGGPMDRVDPKSLGFDFNVPIFFFEGTEDAMAPIEPVEQYFKGIVAPHKEFVRFEGADHFLPFNRPDEFLAQLLARVRPLATPNN